MANRDRPFFTMQRSSRRSATRAAHRTDHFLPSSSVVAAAAAAAASFCRDLRAHRQTHARTHILHPAVRVCDVSYVRSAGDDDAMADELVTGLSQMATLCLEPEIAATPGLARLCQLAWWHLPRTKTRGWPGWRSTHSRCRVESAEIHERLVPVLRAPILVRRSTGAANDRMLIISRGRSSPFERSCRLVESPSSHPGDFPPHSKIVAKHQLTVTVR